MLDSCSIYVLHKQTYAYNYIQVWAWRCLRCTRLNKNCVASVWHVWSCDGQFYLDTCGCEQNRPFKQLDHSCASFTQFYIDFSAMIDYFFALNGIIKRILFASLSKSLLVTAWTTKVSRNYQNLVRFRGSKSLPKSLFLQAFVGHVFWSEFGLSFWVITVSFCLGFDGQIHWQNHKRDGWQFQDFNHLFGSDFSLGPDLNMRIYSKNYHVIPCQK